jgi:hypothetical protein
MTKIRNYKAVFVSVIECWNLRFVCYLVLGVWDFFLPALLITLSLPTMPLNPDLCLQVDLEESLEHPALRPSPLPARHTKIVRLVLWIV